MSTPYPNEFGDWIWLSENNKYVYDKNKAFKNHIEFFNELNQLTEVKRDIQLKNRAIYNIKNFPLKFVKNWIANIGRLFFNYPKSYHLQDLKAYFYMVPNMFLVVISLICIYYSFKGRKLLRFEIKALMLFVLIYIAGSSLLSAVARYLIPIVPIVVFWITFTLKRIVKIEIREN